LAYLAAVALNYSGSSIIGYFSDLNFDRNLNAMRSTEALAAAFPGPAGWTASTGRVTHGRLTRRAWISGERDGKQFSEQVLKVGWPFTTVRGFVRVRADEVESEGVVLIEDNPKVGPVRFWPVQPVWPGMLINSLAIAALLWLVLFRPRS
jgi:hypothetical protein